MTNKQYKQLKKVINNLPRGEKFDRMYNVLKDKYAIITNKFVIISKDKNGCENYYKVTFEKKDKVIIEKF